MSKWWTDLAFAVRQLSRRPAFTLAAILTLGLGIGAVAVLTSVVDAVLLQPLPYPEPDQLVAVREVTPHGMTFSTSEPNYLDFSQASSFRRIGAAGMPVRRTLLAEGEPRLLRGLPVTTSYLDVFGERPLLGRSFHEGDATLGTNAHVLVLSHQAWQEHFAGDPDIVGRQVQLDRESWTVLGVMPPTDTEVDFWSPFVAGTNDARGDHRLRMVARLAPGVSRQQAEAELRTIAARLATEYPDTNEGWSVRLFTWHELRVGNGPEVAGILFVAVGLLLLLAAVNASSLLLAQASIRSREIGLRSALGATRAALLRQLLTESVVLALAGAATGLLLAAWAIPVVRRFGVLPRLEDAVFDVRVVLVTSLVAVLTGMLFGLLPALQVSQTRLCDALRQGDGDRAPHRLRDHLVVVELALATLLVLSSGLLMRSFFHRQAFDVGYDLDRVLAVRLALPPEQYPEMAPQTAVAFRDMVAAVEALPEIEVAGATIINPLDGGGFSAQVAPEGSRNREDFIPCEWRTVAPGYFQTLETPVVEGRVFDQRDIYYDPQAYMAEAAARMEEGGQEPVVAPVGVVVNENLARRLWNTESVVGKRLLWGAPDSFLLEVIGVVPDINDLWPGREDVAILYFSQEQVPFPETTLIARAADGVGLEAAAQAIHRALRKARKDLVVPVVEPLEQRFAWALTGARTEVFISGLFAVVALLLAAAGVYAVASFAVARRQRELGIRLAMGARPVDLFLLVMRRGAVQMAAGLTLGVLAALAFGRVLAGMLYQTRPTDPLTYASVALVLALAVALAALVPARRAARVDPRETLIVE